MCEETEKVSSTFGHTKGERTRSFCVYTVYNNKTDFPVIVDGEARKCAKAMGITLDSFYCYVDRRKKGRTPKRWYIEKRYIDGKPDYTGRRHEKTKEAFAIG